MLQLCERSIKSGLQRLCVLAGLKKSEDEVFPENDFDEAKNLREKIKDKVYLKLDELCRESGYEFFSKSWQVLIEKRYMDKETYSFLKNNSLNYIEEYINDNRREIRENYFRLPVPEITRE